MQTKSKAMIKLIALISSFLIVISVQSQELDFPIFNSKPERGLFSTFEEFIINKPRIVDSFYVELKPRKNEVWEDTPTLIPRFVKNNRKIQNIWGFSDGQSVFIYYQNEYFQVDIYDEEISFLAFADIDELRLQNVGVFAGPLHAGIATEKARKASRSQRIKYIIDPLTGEIVNSTIEYDKEGKIKIYTTDLIFYRDGKKELDQPFKFTFGDDKIYSLPPNSCFELKVEVSDEPLFVCFGEGLKECKALITDEHKKYYMECSISSKKKVPTLTEVDDVNGEYYYALAKKAQKRRDNKKD